MNLSAVDIHVQLFSQERTPRSDAYREGAMSALRHHLECAKTRCPYTAGSAEFDAYYAGWMEGRSAADKVVLQAPAA